MDKMTQSRMPSFRSFSALAFVPMLDLAVRTHEALSHGTYTVAFKTSPKGIHEMEVVYEGPRGLFSEFQIAVCEAAGAEQLIIDHLEKGWVTDEVVRHVVQFELDEARNGVEVIRFLRHWAESKAHAVRVSESDENESGDEGARSSHWDVPMEAMHILTDEEVADLTDEERGIAPNTQ
jgi:hypothetical protein